MENFELSEESDNTPLESEESDNENNTMVEILKRPIRDLERLKQFGLLKIHLFETARLDTAVRERVAQELKKYRNGDVDKMLDEPTVYILTEDTPRELSNVLNVPASYLAEQTRSLRPTVKIMSMLKEDLIESGPLIRPDDQSQSQVYETLHEETTMHKVETVINEVTDKVFNKWVDDIGIKAVADLEQRRDTRSYGHSVIDAAVESELVIVISKHVIAQYCIENSIDEAELRTSIVAEKLPSRVEQALVELVETRALTSIKNLPGMFKQLADATNPFKSENMSDQWEETLPFTPLGQRLPSSTILTKRTPRSMGRLRQTLTELKEEVNTTGQAAQAPSGVKGSSQIENGKTKKKPNLVFDSSSDESDNEVMVNAVITSTYDSTKDPQRLDHKAIPLWKFGETQEEKFQRLEQYIADLIMFNKLEYNIPDSRLIFLSLNASNRSFMTAELPSEALSDLNKYIQHLQRAYGRSMLDLRMQLSQARQRENESPYSWLTRLITCYYRSKRQAPKTLAEIMERYDPVGGEILGKLKTPEVVSEILQLYLTGLKDQRVLAQLRMDLHNITLDQVCQRTKDVSEALGQLPKATIQAISQGQVKDVVEKQDTGPDIVNQIAALIREKSNNDRCNYCNRTGHTWRNCFKRQNDEKGNGKPKNANNGGERRGDKCFSCGKSGHWAKDCQKSKADTGLEARQMICFRCGRAGHKSSSCRVQLGRATKK